MRLIVLTSLVLAGVLAAGAAQAQLKPMAPIGSTKPLEPKPTPGFQPFKPYEPPKPIKPITGVDPNTAPSGLYPELHRKSKKHDGF